MLAGRTPAAVAAHGLSRRFGDIQAVSGLSFAAPHGAVTGILGPAGSGKSTTLRMLVGLVRPDAGSSEILGSPFHEIADPARVVGAVLDTRGPHPGRSALDHLRVYAAAIGVPDERARRALHLVGLTDGTTRRVVGTFSLGMRQRLLLATALLGDPRVLVLDDPTDGADADGVAWLRRFLAGFARSGRSVLLASDRVEDVAPILDHVVVVARGVLVHEGPMDQLRAAQQPRLCIASNDPLRLATALAAAGIVDVRGLPDGRVAVTGSDSTTVGRVAARSGVTIHGAAHETVHLDELLRAMISDRFAAPRGVGDLT